MQKVELIYVHALLAAVHEYLADRHDLPESFPKYDAEVGPYQIQHRKADHEAAARTLAAHIADELSTDEPEPELSEP
ncbi:UPF0058 family protein [Halorussus marinus]|uniref:UPF0058 family protein n=1 Tax=Halorussus marinus TaxID=2505976 RepID=UPI00106DD645|nr:UPF0058 family protein [Halorussus marinus]